MLRLFESGHREESRVIANLRAAGMNVWDRDDTGAQLKFDMFSGHFSGSVDGIICNVPEAPKTPHILEIKTANEKAFKSLVKNGVEKSKPVHFAQMQTYMGAFCLTRALYVCVNKNSDEIFVSRHHFDKASYGLLISKAHRIVFSDEPLEKSDGFSCRWCEYQGICKKEELPEINCRTCAHVTPEPDGTWSCARGKEWPCGGEHIFNPCFVDSDAVDADEEAGWIRYADGRVNGVGYLKSEEMGWKQ